MAIIIWDWRNHVNDENLSGLEEQLRECHFLNDDGVLVIDDLKYTEMDMLRMLFGAYFEDFDKMIKDGEEVGDKNEK